MTWIEGIGDEVTLFFMLLLVIIVGVVAWVSTSIVDQPLIRTVLILERRSVHRQPVEPVESTLQSSIETSIDTGQSDVNNAESSEDFAGASYQPCDRNNSQNINEPAWELANSNPANEVSAVPSQSEPPECEHPVPEDSTSESMSPPEAEVEEASCALRSRRLAFFQNRQSTLLEGPLHPEHIQPEAQTDVSSNAAGNIRIRLKYLNDDQKMVEGKLEEQLGDFKRRHFSPELSADKLVRLIFNGHVLQSDNETLQGCGLFDNCVVHCLVHQQRTTTTNQSELSAGREGNPNNNSGSTDGMHLRDWDMGHILLITLSLLIGVGWYCRFLYGQLFNATTTVALAGLTGILAISLFGIYLPDQDLAMRH